MKRILIHAALLATFTALLACAGLSASADLARSARYDVPKEELFDGMKLVLRQEGYEINREVLESGNLETPWQFRNEPSGQSRTKVSTRIMGERPYEVLFNVECMMQRQGSSWEENNLLGEQRTNELHLALYRQFTDRAVTPSTGTEEATE